MIVENLSKWRDERNVHTPNHKQYFMNVLEELLEDMYDKEDIQYAVQSITDAWYLDDVKIDINQTIDKMCDISVFTINEIENNGYDYCKSMDETFKEINSRKQDPIQKMLWDRTSPQGKWKKDSNQDKTTLYKARYNECKRTK